MDARFRVRTHDERELRPSSLDEFADLVAAGEIRPGDLVYDALTGEWAPAQAHPVYHLVTDPLSGLQADEGASAGDSPAPSPISDDAADEPMAFDLVEARQVSPEEEARAFVAQMAEERANETEGPTLGLEMPLTDARAASLASEPATGVDGSAGRPRARGEGASVVTGPVVMPNRRGRRGPRGSWIVVGGLAVAGLAATAVVARPDLRFGPTLPRRAEAAPTPRGATPVATSEAELRSAAWDGFVAAVEQTRTDQGVGRVPEGWLDGAYLADAASRPDIADFWTTYLRFIESVHEGDTDRYRDAYLQRLDATGAGGPVRSLRLAAALADFEAARPAREDLYARAWELATSALDLHRLLVALDGRIAFEPARGERLSADPVLEAAGTDDESQERLETALDRVLVALHQAGGEPPAGAAGVPGWLPEALARLPEG
ncbi:MAG: hypothetical protein RJQ04_02945 [Longimicrobiales bacterium]